ncbi:hypothetical protein CHRY9293_03661 [Chryseobacterium potabilaquae]|uniref:Uncharacterized protein n=1 Tax=Chryseobacterium potabilaquae TaxID=2675057 RepID=A0A6N4XDS5_9FLAO|nr:hypothetical protein CHRY9293_03661 [Chryseobacterium potabilaquae]
MFNYVLFFLLNYIILSNILNNIIKIRIVKKNRGNIYLHMIDNHSFKKFSH